MKKPGFETRRRLYGMAFVSPFVVGILVFFLFPLYISVKLSFGKVVKISGFEIKWAGFDQYVRAFLIDVNFVPMFLNVVRQTLTRLPLIIVFSLIISIIINKNIKFKGFFRIAFFLPFLLGTGDVMRQALQLQLDRQVLAYALDTLISRQILAYLGPQVVSAVQSFFSVIVVVLWSSGVQILLFLSGLQGIPVSLYESARVDGATEWEMFWSITLPMIAPMAMLNVIYTVVDSFVNVSNPILNYIQVQAFNQRKWEYAAAMGWIYFTFIIMVVLLTMGIINYYISLSLRSEVKRRG